MFSSCIKMLSTGKIQLVAIFGLVLLVQQSIANSARTCHSCLGINCLRTSVSSEQQCLDPLDYCVTIFDKFNVVQKGCSLEIPIELRERCDRNSPECHKCNSDRCNSLGQEDFVCLQCDSRTDANCSANPATIAATRCNSPTAPNSYCYVKYENNVTWRGCAISVADQLSCYESDSCRLCLPGDVQGCNNVDFTSGTRAMLL